MTTRDEQESKTKNVFRSMWKGVGRIFLLSRQPANQGRVGQASVSPQILIETATRRAAGICFGLVCGVAGFAWIALELNHLQLAAFGSDYVPMAPSTAGLLLLFGTVQLLRSQNRTLPTVLEWGCVVAVALGAAFVVAQSLFGYPWPAEHLSTEAAGPLGNIPLGQMSPITALAFLLSAAAYACQLPRWSVRRAFRYSAFGMSLGVFLIGLTIAGGYAIGTPMLYGTRTVPMALPAAISFFLLGLGLLLASRDAARFLMLLTRPSEELWTEAPPRVDRLTTAASVLLVCAIAVSGIWLLAVGQKSERAVIHGYINAIANLKAERIAEVAPRNRAAG